MKEGEWERILFLEGQAERQRLMIEKLEQENASLTELIHAQSEEFHADLRVQGHQWSVLMAEKNLELNRQTGIIVRQRLTIEEQADKITYLRDQIQYLKDRREE